MDDIDKLVSEAPPFRKVAALADAEFIADSITVKITPKPPRQPAGLPAGKMVVCYQFGTNPENGHVQVVDLMVARDGVQPPTPAFSGLYSAIHK